MAQRQHDPPPSDVLLQRLRDRDAEMAVLRQRLDFLLIVPDHKKLAAIPPMEGGLIAWEGKEALVLSPSSTRDQLKAWLVKIFRSQQQASERPGSSL